MISKVDLSKFDPNLNFNVGKNKFIQVVWYVVKVIFFLTAVPFPSRIKVQLLRIFGAKVSDNVVIKPRVNIHFPWKLVLGNNCWIGEEVCILNFEDIIVGNNVCLSQRVFLCSGNHDFRDPHLSYKNGPIEIESGVWIGACSFVSPNSRVGCDTIVRAYSFVGGSLEENSVYGGNPLLKLKNRWT